MPRVPSQRRHRIRGSTVYPQILARIKPPVFPEARFRYHQIWSKAGVDNDSTPAIANAIDACSKAGGGRVVVPAGEFLTGAIHLKINVNLYISKGATLKFSTDPKNYPIVHTRWEGMELMSLFAVHLRLRADEYRDHRRRHARRTGPILIIGGNGTATRDYGWKDGMPNQKAARAKLYEMMARRLPVERARFRRGFISQAEFHPAVSSARMF